MGYEANRRIEFDNDDMEDIQKRFDFYIEGMTQEFLSAETLVINWNLTTIP